ncbi:hypothetical protein FSARC_12980 [Fusarium sarcochroum]|uniref:PNPLA domain-containing protein n=1 Tax=Fusarium sarcochroum TaxID=1208366 RepID=A0A8H4WV69_9HYPO|nr:hypothetical protein FSARC_12980 [Fusarium sarcochroum]
MIQESSRVEMACLSAGDVMLGRLRISVDGCIDAYNDLSDRIFRKQKHRVTLGGSVQGRFDSEELERAIKKVIQEQGFDVNEPLKDDRNARCKVFVCAIRKEISHPVHFRSYRYSPTSATTSFFDPITIGKYQNEFMDGAPGNNNPVRSVFTEAATNWDLKGRLPGHLGCLVSIGTGMPSTKPYGDKFSEIAKTLVKIATESEATAMGFVEEYSFLEDNDIYYRCNVMQGLQGVALEDAASKPTIVAATEAYLEGRHVFKRMKACAARLNPHINDLPQDVDKSQASSQAYGRSHHLGLPASTYTEVPWSRNSTQLERVEELDRRTEFRLTRRSSVSLTQH